MFFIKIANLMQRLFFLNYALFYQRVSLGIFCTILIVACGDGKDFSANRSGKYHIVIDAGSTGSRIFIYKKENGVFSRYQSIPIMHDPKQGGLAKTEPGLAETKGTVAEKIEPLLIAAQETLKNYGIQRKDAMISVLGTAGMRLRKKEDQITIYDQVTKIVAQKGFTVDQIQTISGEDEALFAWVDVNLQADTFKENGKTKGILELGGASAQIAFESLGNSTSNVIKVYIYQKEYTVYRASFLGLGLNEARRAMLEQKDYFYCYPLDYAISDNVSGKFHTGSCKALFTSILSDKKFQKLKEISAELRKNPDQFFIGLSGLYYTLDFFDAQNYVSHALFSNHIENVCNQHYSSIISYADRHKKGNFNIFNQCANASYVDALLFDSIQIKDANLSGIKNIVENAELSWTLGYVTLKDFGYTVTGFK